MKTLTIFLFFQVLGAVFGELHQTFSGMKDGEFLNSSASKAISFKISRKSGVYSNGLIYVD